MKVVCIENKRTNYLSQVDDQLQLTIGKIYEVENTLISKSGFITKYWIRNDVNRSRWIPIYLFKTIDEWREKQLEDLDI